MSEVDLIFEAFFAEGLVGLDLTKHYSLLGFTSKVNLNARRFPILEQTGEFSDFLHLAVLISKLL